MFYVMSGRETDAMLIINDFLTSYATGTKCRNVNQADYRCHIMFLGLEIIMSSFNIIAVNISKQGVQTQLDTLLDFHTLTFISF